MFIEAVFSGVKKNMIFLLLLTAVFAANCRIADTPPVNQNMREYTNKNGLTVKLPEKLTAREDGDGFIIEPSDGSNKNVRFPVEIFVKLHKGEMTQSENFSEQKIVGGRNIKYDVKKSDGGSGGERYDFFAIEMIDGGYISYQSGEQSEYDEPEFKTVRQIIENTSVRK